MEQRTRRVRDTPQDHSPQKQMAGTHGPHRDEGDCRGLTVYVYAMTK